MLLTRDAIGWTLAGLVASGCAGARNDSRSDTPNAAVPGQTQAATHPLVNTSWRLTHFGEEGALAQGEATLEFSEDGRVAGRGSCNHYSGPVEIDRESIDFGVLAATRMACAEEIMRQEARYFGALNEAERWEMTEDSLRIHHRGDDSPLRFARRLPGN